VKARTWTADPLRSGLLGLAALGIVGTGIELAVLRHWGSPLSAIPWFALAAGGVAIWLIARRPGRRVVLGARAIGLLMALAGAYGVAVHVSTNMGSAVLDGTVGPIWRSLPLWRQVWMAASGGVGPAPPLAAGSLAPTGLALTLATLGHPALDPAPDLNDSTALSGPG